MKKLIVAFLLITFLFVAVSSSLQAYDSGILMVWNHATIRWTPTYHEQYGPFSSGFNLWSNGHTWFQMEVNLPYAMQGYLTFYAEFTGPSQPYEDLKVTVNGSQTRYWYEDNTWPAGWWQFTVTQPFNFQAGTNTIHITHPQWPDDPPGGGSVGFNNGGNGWFRITTFIPSRGLLRLAFLPGACVQRMDLRKVKITKAGRKKDL